MTIFLDGTGITPGSEGCKCSGECDFPCWQRLGWAPACDGCGCKIYTGYKEPGVAFGPLHFQRNAWAGFWITWRNRKTLTLLRPRLWEIV